MPPFCSADAPPGEVELFKALATNSETSGWIVLHSLGIANHERLVEGEADFIVIVPDHGILVLEVKSHHSVERFENGLWKLGQQAPTSRSPFRQASEAMYSIINYLGSRGEQLRTTPVLSAVWFTHIRAKAVIPKSPEWQDWQVLDLEDMRSVDRSVLKVLDLGTRHLAKPRDPDTSSGIGPTLDLALRIAALLRPKFELARTASDSRNARNSQLVELIEEQFEALDAMAANRQVLFTGAAGTGKTLLAIETARRRSASNRSGLLICFNTFLGRQLLKHSADIRGLKTTTFHNELLRIAGITVPQNDTRSFWQQELPAAALEALLNEDRRTTADFLIVDEAQDLIDDDYLDVLDLLVTGGLSAGRVAFFGDFERQAIFGSNHNQEALHQRIPKLATFNLTVNCRNLPRIGTVVNAFSRLNPGYRRYRRRDDGVDPELLPYSTREEQEQLLVKAVRNLLAEGFKLEEIVVLSSLRSESAAMTSTNSWLKQVLRPEDGDTVAPGKLRYATIQAFKGLEAPAVVLTDLDDTLVPGFKALLYVALTRATDRLVALMTKDTLQSAIGGRV